MTTQKDQKTKEETERRDRLIFELITERFRLEWQRISDLDGKAMGIVGFVGIIISLQAGLGGFLLKEVSRTSDTYIPLCILFLSSVILLLCSILCGLKAYFIQSWDVVPESNHLIENYGKKDRSRIVILRIVSKELSNAIIKNKATNDDKCRFINFGFVFLILGIVFVIFFIGSLLLV